MSQSSTAILHDYFGIRGGGERLVLTLAQAVHADLFYGYRTADSYPDNMFAVPHHDLSLPDALRRPGLRTAALAMRFSMARRSMQRYETRIFSGASAPFAAPDAKKGRNVYYCHTPPRFLYDQKDRFAFLAQSAQKRLLLELYRRAFERAVSRMDLIIANSQTVRERVQRYLSRDAIVVHPPCDTDIYEWLGQDDFYLSTARLSPLKRVDLIVEAFRTIPDRRLVIASGGEELEQLRAAAQGAPNITFTGWISDARMRELTGRCIATIYVPHDEDFGISPVESMAAGKPVIGVAEGGLRETIIGGETGILLPPGFGSADIANAVIELDAAHALKMRGPCQTRATHFSRDRFVAGMQAALYN